MLSYNFIFIILAPLIKNKILDLKDLATLASIPISQGLGKNFIQQLFLYLLILNGPKFLQDLWVDSKVNWNDFIIQPEEIEPFISHNVWFVVKL